MNTRAEWHSQQIAEFLGGVSGFRDEAAALEGAVERVAEVFEAEVAAILRDGVVIASVGFRAGHVPDEAVLAAEGSGAVLPVPGVGECSVLSVPLGSGGRLMVARSGGGFTSEEALLLRGMGRVLELALRTLGAVSVLQERQTLFERLFRIQRSISHRMPIREVLDSITEGAAELLGDDTAALLVVDEDAPEFLDLASASGIDPVPMHSLRRTSIAEGVTGRAIAEQRLIVADDYRGSGLAHPALAEQGLRSAMAAPVSRVGTVVGALLVGSSVPRRYSAAEQDVLLAFAEHASLALGDASAVDGMRQAFGHALHQATHDPLTGLPNRSLVLDRLSQALARANRTGVRVTVLFVDLDRFKVVNDSFGHSAGDYLLTAVSERLRAAVRGHDTVGRLAGDEFVVICEEISDEEALEVAGRVAGSIAEPLWLDGRETVVTASIGIAHGGPHARAEDMLRDSDLAMYQAKEHGRSRIERFDAAMRLRLLQRLGTEQALRSAIAGGELRLHYQPIVALGDWRVTATEALVRWEHPERGLVPPDEFVPLAEDCGLSLPLGRWVLTEACAQLARWRASGRSGLSVAVNLSARQFADPDLIGVVAEAIGRSGLPAGGLSFELTESVLMGEAEASVEVLRALKALGVHFSVDDFGTGYSSLSHLKRLPVDLLKIDRSFVDGLGVDPEDSAVVDAVISLARALDLGVVAEGVEHVGQLAVLRDLGCQAVQGFLLGHPGPGEDLPDLAPPGLAILLPHPDPDASVPAAHPEAAPRTL